MNDYETLLAEIANATSLADSVINNSEKPEEGKLANNSDKAFIEKVTNAVLAKMSEKEEKDKAVKNVKEKLVEEIINTVLTKLNKDEKEDGVQNEDEDKSTKGVKNTKVKNTDEDKPANGVKNTKVKNEDDLDELPADFKEKLAGEVIKIVLAKLNKDGKEDGVQNEDENKDKDKDKDKPTENTNDDDKVKNQDCDKNKTDSNVQNEVFSELVAARQREVSKLIDEIVTNSQGVYAKEDLAEKSFLELQKLYGLLSKVASQPVNNSSAFYGDSLVYDQAVENAENAGLDIPSTFPVA
jgi:hypothetical protein